MRVARFSLVLLLVLALAVPAGIAPPPVFASSQQDSIPPPRPLVATIHLERGDSIRAAYVGPWGHDVLRFETVDGWIGYLSLHKIARVVDGAGSDVSRRVLDERKPLGSKSTGARPRPALGGPPGSWMSAPFTYPSTRTAKSYAITEVSVLGRPSRHEILGNGTLYLAGLGSLFNLSPSFGLGAVGHFGGGDLQYRCADAGLRVRYAPSDRVGFETTHGIFWGSAESWETHGVSYFGEGAITVADALSLVVRAESAEWERELGSGLAWSPPGYRYEQRRTETMWRVGAKIGPYPRWVTIPAIVAAAILFLTPRETLIY